MAKTQKVSARRWPIPWHRRVVFVPASSRQGRRVQYKKQRKVLIGVMVLSVLVALLTIRINYHNAATLHRVNCHEYPQFCVPFAPNSESNRKWSDLETPATRKFDEASHGVAGVVRGIDSQGIPFIGDPNAPIHFVSVSDFACSHCQDYHTDDVERFIEDEVLRGRATFGHVLKIGVGGSYTETASQAALCAGEQGAFWEMSDLLFHLGQVMSPSQAFSIEQIRDSSEDMDLDSERIIECVLSRKYQLLLTQHQVFANNNGVSGTPTVLYRYADSDRWIRLPSDARGFSSLLSLTEEAN